MATLFEKIINGEIPCFKLYEDDLTFAFLTRDAIRPGHSLIVPKVAVDHFSEVPEPYYTAVFTTAKKLSRAIQEATGCRRVGTAIVGFEVPHFHYHLVPMDGIKDLDFSRARVLDPDENASMQEKILEALKEGK